MRATLLVLLLLAPVLLLPAAPVPGQQTGTGLVPPHPDLDPGRPPHSQGRIKATMTGFTDGLPGSLPKRNKPYETIPPLSLPDPATATVVIWSHGTANSQRLEYCSSPGNALPESVRALEEAGVYIYFVCSEVAVLSRPETAGRYIHLRMAEVDRAIRDIAGLGVPENRIFLAGHSAGAWTSLMLAADWGARIGGMIAFAPAFAGPRDNPEYPWWREEARPRLIGEMLRAETIRALVFAYEADEYNRPADLAFLTETWPGGVELVAYGCDPANDHMSHLHDCRPDETARRIRDFVLGPG